jgi:hypothetical protein
MGLTENERAIVEQAARAIVDCGDLDEFLRQLFNQVVNECKRAGVNHRSIFRDFIDDLQDRLDSPQTSGEFFDCYGHYDDPLEVE